MGEDVKTFTESEKTKQEKQCEVDECMPDVSIYAGGPNEKEPKQKQVRKGS